MRKLLILFLLIFSVNLEAQEFINEATKLKWVKETFKDQRMFDLWHRDGYEELGKQVMHDFINQNNIEVIEPIAKGANIDNPNIAKFNQACPKEKSINLYKSVSTNYPIKVFYEDCLLNMKVFRINPYNNTKNDAMHILFCSDFEGVREHKEKPSRISDWCESFRGMYFSFNPNKCEYNKPLIGPVFDDCKNYVSGIFRYKNKIYFYEITFDPTFHDVEEDIFVDRLNIMIYTSVHDEIKAITSAGFVDKQYHPFPDEVLQKKFEDEWQRILDIQQKIINESKQKKENIE